MHLNRKLCNKLRWLNDVSGSDSFNTYIIVFLIVKNSFILSFYDALRYAKCGF